MTTETHQRDWEPRRIAIIGAGAMGSSLAAMLDHIAPTIIVCRNPMRAAALVRDGARTTGAIRTASRPIVVRRIADLARVGGVSALFIATKTTAIPEVARELKGCLGEISDQEVAPYIISYQNGIEPGRQMMELLGTDRVLRMVLNFGATMGEADDAVDLTFNQPPHWIGGISPAHLGPCQLLAALLTSAGLETEVAPDIEAEVWRKGIVNAAVNPVAALTNSTIREVMNSPAEMIVMRLLDEGIAVASNDGIDLGEGFLERTISLLRSAGDHTPTMVEDIRRGRESEVGQLNRQIIEHARRRSVPVPTHEVVDALIETFDFRAYAASHGGQPPAPASKEAGGAGANDDDGVAGRLGTSGQSRRPFFGDAI